MKSELDFGDGGITTTGSGIGICRSDENGDDDPGMVASPSPPPSSVVRGPGHCRGRVSGTTHSVPFSHQTKFHRLRQAESHTPTITTNLRLPPTTGEMRQTKFLLLRRAAVRTHAIRYGASGGTWQRTIQPAVVCCTHLRREWPKAGCCTGQECAVPKITYDASDRKTSPDAPGIYFWILFWSSRPEHNQWPPTDTAKRRFALIPTRRKIIFAAGGSIHPPFSSGSVVCVVARALGGRVAISSISS